MKNILKENLGGDISVHPVCSVSIKKRSGDETKPYGKEEIIKSVFKILWKDISKKIAEDTEKEIKEELYKKLDFIQEKVLNITYAENDLFKIPFFNSKKDNTLDKVFEKYDSLINKNLQNTEIEISKILSDSIENIENFYRNFYDKIIYVDIKAKKIVTHIDLMEHFLNFDIFSGTELYDKRYNKKEKSTFYKFLNPFSFFYSDFLEEIRDREKFVDEIKKRIREIKSFIEKDKVIKENITKRIEDIKLNNNS